MKFLEISEPKSWLLNAIVFAVLAIVFDLLLQVIHFGSPKTFDDLPVAGALYFLFSLIILKIYSIPKFGVWIAGVMGFAALIVLIFRPDLVWG